MPFDDSCTQMKEWAAMAAAVMEMEAATVSVDEFQALEQKVLQTVELIKMERAARAACEAEAVAAQKRLAEGQERLHELTAKDAEKDALIAQLREQIAGASTTQQHELESLHRERETVRRRVESMLSTLDELLV